MRRAGFRNLAEVARTVFAGAPTIRHVLINRADTRLSQTHLRRAAWLPNLTEPHSSPPVGRVRAARRWIEARLGVAAPIWLLPCRVLRRKNIAEALLLMRWLRPEAWLVTTAGVSSADEMDYAERLTDTARRHRWPLRLGVLRHGHPDRPGMAECSAASEVVLLTSIQEGFGLPYLEAAAAGRPLIARRLPNIAPDLRLFGFRFPQSYDEVRVSTDCFD
jgi:glycosyltransferase involved in cell wall biosynthesis